MSINSSLFGVLVDIISSLIWPFVVLIIVLILMFHKNASQRISEIFRGFKSVKMFGAEFVMSEEGRQQVTKGVREAFQEYRNQAKAEYDRLAGANNIRGKLEQVLSTIKVQVEGKEKSLKEITGLRCTIHVPDAIFAETMYQLLDYYPMSGGRGRIFSVRYGILGKAWRSGESITKENVPKDKRELILDWGMTREEAAAAGQGRQTFSCIVLCNKEETAVGVLYMDVPKKNAFGGKNESDKPAFHKEIFDKCQDYNLIAGLDNIKRELMARAPIIKIYG